jgi:riboflavin synthase
VLDGTRAGDSIAVNGCCLTVVEVQPPPPPRDEGEAPASGTWTADVMLETLDRTSLRGSAPGDRVNLERAVTPATRLGGHLVQGHVDAVGKVRDRRPGDRWEVVEVELPPGLHRYVVEKGSITVDGVSLTVVAVAPDAFTVSLIPETLARTTLGFRQPGDRVNLEVDLIAKHVERLLQAAGRLGPDRPREAAAADAPRSLP